MGDQEKPELVWMRKKGVQWDNEKKG